VIVEFILNKTNDAHLQQFDCYRGNNPTRDHIENMMLMREQGGSADRKRPNPQENSPDGADPRRVCRYTSDTQGHMQRREQVVGQIQPVGEPK